MKTKIIFNIILVIILLASCTPDTFMLNQKETNRIYGLKMCPLDSAKKLKDNALMLYDGGRIALKSIQETQLIRDFTLETSSGSGVRFAFRTARNNYDEHPAVVFDFTTNGSKIYENNELVLSVDTVSLSHNEPRRITIKNDGEIYEIVVDCDTVAVAASKLPATEYIIVGTLPGTEALLSGINFAEILEEF